LENPDWDAALKEWSTLELKAPTNVERETMRLHSANVMIKQGKLDAAKAILDKITEPALQKQKDKLLATLAPPADNESK
jgi:hypothetical protein